MIAFVFTLFLVAVEWICDSKKREREAYSKGYDAMQSALNSTYSEDYDALLVLSSYSKLDREFKGTENERRAYEEGMRDAVTVYERSFGAP